MGKAWRERGEMQVVTAEAFLVDQALMPSRRSET